MVRPRPPGPTAWLLKKDSVTGIIGKTHGVRLSSRPPTKTSGRERTRPCRSTICARSIGSLLNSIAASPRRGQVVRVEPGERAADRLFERRLRQAELRLRLGGIESGTLARRLNSAPRQQRLRAGGAREQLRRGGKGQGEPVGHAPARRGDPGRARDERGEVLERDVGSREQIPLAEPATLRGADVPHPDVT